LPEIHLEETDSLTWALKQFKRKMQTAGIFRELRRRRHYTKPSIARAMKSKAARRARNKSKQRGYDE